MKNIGIFTISIIIGFMVIYIVNFVKLTNCDFKSDFKCEVVHGIGLIPALTIFTVWYGVDE